MENDHAAEIAQELRKRTIIPFSVDELIEYLASQSTDDAVTKVDGWEAKADEFDRLGYVQIRRIFDPEQLTYSNSIGLYVFDRLAGLVRGYSSNRVMRELRGDSAAFEDVQKSGVAFALLAKETILDWGTPNGRTDRHVRPIFAVPGIQTYRSLDHIQETQKRDYKEFWTPFGIFEKRVKTTE